MKAKLVFWLVVLLGLGALTTFLLSPTKLILPETAVGPAALNLAILADIHSDLENLEKALTLIKQQNLEPVIILGDLTNLGKKADLEAVKTILDHSQIPYFVIPGNHDLWFGRRTKANLFREVFGPDFQTFKKAGYKFILVNNGDDYLGVSGITGEDNLSQLDWLKTELKECLNLDCLIFLHEPLNHPYSGNLMGEYSVSVASEAAVLISLFKEFRVKEIFAGHLHLTNEYQLEGLKTTIVGAISADRNPQQPNFLKILNLEQRENVFLPTD
jgi:3',5'-cyclic AMP phosphodiesterase CpdA